MFQKSQRSQKSQKLENSKKSKKSTSQKSKKNLKVKKVFLKASIWETPNLLSDADRSTITKKNYMYFFLGGGTYIRTHGRTYGRTYGGTDGQRGHMSPVNISPITRQCSAMQWSPPIQCHSALQ